MTSRLWIRVPWPLLLAVLVVGCTLTWQHLQVNAECAYLDRINARLLAELERPELRAGTYTLTRAIDGDTIEIDHGLARIRLADVDSPEIWERHEGRWRMKPDAPEEGLRAWRKLQALEGAQVTVRPVARDRYGRTVAHVDFPGK